MKKAQLLLNLLGQFTCRLIFILLFVNDDSILHNVRRWNHKMMLIIRLQLWTKKSEGWHWLFNLCGLISAHNNPCGHCGEWVCQLWGLNLLKSAYRLKKRLVIWVIVVVERQILVVDYWRWRHLVKAVCIRWTWLLREVAQLWVAYSHFQLRHSFTLLRRWRWGELWIWLLLLVLFINKD